MSTPNGTVSRRESLKRLTGALALGLGAPAALAATMPQDDGEYRLALYKPGQGEPYLIITMENVQARTLMSDQGRNVIEVQQKEGGSYQSLGRARWKL